MEISSAILIVTGIANLSLGLLIFIRNKKDPVNIFYGIIALGVSIWCLSIYFFRIVPDVNLFWSRVAYVSAAIVGFFYLYFTLFFPYKNKLRLFWHIFFIIFFLSVTWLIIGTNSILKSYVVVNSVNGLEFGGAYIIYNLFIFTFFGFGLTNLLLKHFRSVMVAKLQIKYVLVGTFISILIGTITNLILFGMGIFKYNWLGPSSSLFLVGFIGYAIVKHRVMNIRVILTEALIGVVGFILLIEVVISESMSQFLLKVVILIAFSYMGYLLLQSVNREIQRRQEIEKIDRAKSEFISIASHQLRTPLTAIKGYISMILEGVYGKLSGKQMKPLENVYYSNERLIKLVNDLLNLSRLDAGKIEFSPEPTSLEEMVSGIVGELKINAERKGLYMKMVKPEMSLPKIMVDQDKLRQVVLNIVDNAIKYTKKGGITIELRKLDDEERIRISDTGEGMTKHEIDSLFQMFSRATAGTQLHAEGAGLGLYVAKQFIEMHGGEIWAESPGKGKGSTFIIKLPVHLDPKLLKAKTKTITKQPDDFF